MPSRLIHSLALMHLSTHAPSSIDTHQNRQSVQSHPTTYRFPCIKRLQSHRTYLPSPPYRHTYISETLDLARPHVSCASFYTQPPAAFSVSFLIQGYISSSSRRSLGSIVFFSLHIVRNNNHNWKKIIYSVILISGKIT